MSWGEAFGRAFGHVFALIGWFVLSFIIMGLGVALARTNDIEDAIPGFIVILIGLIVLSLSSMATAIKLFTDAVTDHVVRRLSSTHAQPDEPPRVNVTS